MGNGQSCYFGALPDVLGVFGVLFDDGEDGGGDDAVGAGEVVINFCREDVSSTLPEKRVHRQSARGPGADLEVSG